MTSETPDVELSSGELGDLAAVYGWWKAHGDPEAFYDVLDAAVQRILAAAEAAHARDLAATWLCSQCGELPSAMVKIGTSDGWCERCLDFASSPPDLAALRERAEVAEAKVAAVERSHRHEWADYIEHWEGAVGPKPPSVRTIVLLLRADQVPFGTALADRPAGGEGR